MAKQHTVYILKCKDGSYYTGYTNDLEKRFYAHQTKKGAKYTKSHEPIEIVHFEEFMTKSMALKREAQIKKLTRTQKEALIGAGNIYLRPVILYIACSLDGYIADKTGSVSFLDSVEEDSYNEFIETVDTIVMGKTTYEHVLTLSDEWVYPNQKTIVLTHHPEADSELIQFTDAPISQILTDCCQHRGKKIWLCGGSNLIAQFMKEKWIDEIQLTVVSKVLGEGVALFTQGTAQEFEVVSCTHGKNYVQFMMKRK